MIAVHGSAHRGDLALGVVAMLFAILGWLLAALETHERPVEYICLAVLSTGMAAVVPVRRADSRWYHVSRASPRSPPTCAAVCRASVSSPLFHAR